MEVTIKDSKSLRDRKGARHSFCSYFRTYLIIYNMRQAKSGRRFPRMKVWNKGGGLPLGEPKDMSLTRKGNQEVRTELLSASCQPLAMYRVVSINRTELISVACAGGGSVGRVTAQGA